MKHSSGAKTWLAFKHLMAVIVALALTVVGLHVLGFGATQQARAEAGAALGEWPYPDGYVDQNSNNIISGGLTYLGVGGDSAAEDRSFRLAISTRAVADTPYEWIYLRMDPRLAPHITKIVGQAQPDQASTSVKYKRLGEKVGPQSAAGYKLVGQPIDVGGDPYANETNVWRFMATNHAELAPSPLHGDDPSFRGALAGNWGLFTPVPLANYKMWAVVTVTLDQPITDFVKENGEAAIYDVDIRWQNNVNRKIIERRIKTGAAITFDRFYPVSATGENGGSTWPTSNAYTQIYAGYTVPLMSASGKNKFPADSNISVLRTVIGYPSAITSYNSGVPGKYKDVDFVGRIDKDLLDTVPDNENIVVWEKFAAQTQKKYHGLNGASGNPVIIPKSQINEDGTFVITTDPKYKDTPQRGYVYTAETNDFLQGNALDPVTGATIVDVPFDQTKLRAKINSNGLKRVRIYSYLRAKDGRLLSHSTTGATTLATASWPTQVTALPEVQNISQGLNDKVSDQIDLAKKNIVRENQNFIQGYAAPEAEVFVRKGEGADSVLIAHTIADENGKWAAKIVQDARVVDPDPNVTDSLLDTATEGTAVTFADLGINAGDKVQVFAQAGLQLVSNPLDVKVEKVQSAKPETTYTADAPLKATDTQIKGTIGGQHQNTTKTKVYAKLVPQQGFSRADDRKASGEIAGNIDGKQTFTIKLDENALKNCPRVILTAREASYPKDAAAGVNDAKDDAYAESEPVEIPTCDQAKVTFDANGGTLGEVPQTVSVPVGQALGDAFPTATPTRTGHEFKGWATTNNAESANFTAQTVVNENTTVYAVWKETADADNDGTVDSKDKCPGTKSGVQVDENGCPVAPSVNQPEKPITGEVGKPLTPAVVPVDNPGQVDYECKAEGLPDGLTIKKVAGGCEISGTPTTPGTSNVTVKVTYPDPAGDGEKEVTGKVPVVINKATDTDGDGIPDYLDNCADTPEGARVDTNGCPLAPVVGDPSGGVTGEVNKPIEPVTVPVTNDGKVEYECKAADLPAGLVINKTDAGCVISGTPTAEANGNVTVKVSYTDPKSKQPVTVSKTVVAKIGPKSPTDADGDGVEDGKDKCPGTKPGIGVDENGCPVAPSVNQPDKPITGEEGKPLKPTTIPVDNPGQVDYECKADGLPEGVHIRKVDGGCEIYGTPTKPGDTQPTITVTYKDAATGTDSSSSNQVDVSIKPATDSDGDGVPDSKDKCPNTPKGAKVDVNGCPVTETETQLSETGAHAVTVTLFALVLLAAGGVLTLGRKRRTVK